jgi:hypothetical protein
MTAPTAVRNKSKIGLSEQVDDTNGTLLITRPVVRECSRVAGKAKPTAKMTSAIPIEIDFPVVVIWPSLIAPNC